MTSRAWPGGLGELARRHLKRFFPSRRIAGSGSISRVLSGRSQVSTTPTESTRQRFPQSPPSALFPIVALGAVEAVVLTNRLPIKPPTKAPNPVPAHIPTIHKAASLLLCRGRRRRNTGHCTIPITNAPRIRYAVWRGAGTAKANCDAEWLCAGEDVVITGKRGRGRAAEAAPPHAWVRL
jgi:hypothetical protein